jgi:hypothetical protein
MTDWFARPVLHVKNVDASLRFYVNLLASRAHGATTRKAGRELHRSTGRAALSFWPTTWPQRRLARG